MITSVLTHISASNVNNINKCKLFMIVMTSSNTNNNQSILEGLIRAMSQLTERNQLI